jgi:N-acetylmuramic acid 6-phosphate etherase
VVRLQGGVFTGQPIYRDLFEQEFRKAWPTADIDVCTTPGSMGSVYLAAGHMPDPVRVQTVAESEVAQAVTEQPNPRSADLGLLPTRKLVELFATEERAVEEAVRHCVPELAIAVDLLTASLQAGGRLFYIGAGTSGRLGLLDASEMPPTFGVEPELVQGVLAGGVAAVMRSSESAEDSREAGALALRDRGVRDSDVVCGITASGRTPYVLGALAEARRLGAGTIFLTCNPRRDRAVGHADVEIDLPTGPEIITGSTRLKAGTATKVALNILSTCVMVRLGRVDGNSMSCLKPTNEKLRRRAAQIVADCAKIDFKQALDLLSCTNWDIREAILRTKSHISP